MESLWKSTSLTACADLLGHTHGDCCARAYTIHFYRDYRVIHQQLNCCFAFHSTVCFQRVNRGLPWTCTAMCEFVFPHLCSDRASVMLWPTSSCRCAGETKWRRGKGKVWGCKWSSHKPGHSNTDPQDDMQSHASTTAISAPSLSLQSTWTAASTS